MNDKNRTKRDLLDEIDRMRRTIEQLENRNVEHLQSAEGTHKRREKFREIFDSMTARIWYFDAEGRVRRLNKAAADFVGLPVRAMVGKTLFDLFPYALARKIQADNREIVHSGKAKLGVVEPYTLSFGGNGWAQYDKIPYYDKNGDVAGVITFAFDVTERRKAEEALLTSQLRLSQAMDLARIVYWEVDPATEEFIFNDAFYDFYGTTADREGGYRMTREEYAKRFIHPDDLPVFDAALKRRVPNRDAEFLNDAEHRIVRRDDEVRHILARIRVTRDAAGEVIRYYGANQDITKRKEAEDRLRENEERFRKIFEESRLGIVMVNSDSRFVRSNHAFCQMLGYTEEELTLLTFKDITHPEHIDEDVAAVNDVIDGKIPVYRTEKRYIRKDGAIVWGSATVSVVRDTTGQFLYFLTMVEDITHRKQAEEDKLVLQSQLLQAQKMEAVGTLAGGIAHDFNNILMALMGYGNLLQMKMDENDPLRVYADQMLAAVGKAANLTQSLLAFGRKQVMELKPHRINELLKDVEKLLRRLLPEDIDLKIALDRDVTIMADMTQIDQMLMNLATNARDAMPEGGELRIETKETRIDGTFKMKHGFGEPGNYVLISVSDTGTGMDEKMREKIFEPFFTTKEVGKGTGLGLSIAYGIVKQHAGYITVQSEPGKGTVFHIYLPAINMVIDEPKVTCSDMAVGNETVLFADDSPDIRRMAADVLTSSGYTVIEAADGRDAVAKFSVNPDAIDLLILDVVMPVKNGKEAYDEMRALRPDVKALFISGYTRDVVLYKGIRDGRMNYIAKPILPAELLKRVRDVLDGRKA